MLGAKTPAVKAPVKKLPAISATDRTAPDFIANATVPAVVDRIFGEVFGRKILPVESTYWKQRARSDKATEAKLRDTMKYFAANGWTYDN